MLKPSDRHTDQKLALEQVCQYDVNVKRSQKKTKAQFSFEHVIWLLLTCGADGFRYISSLSRISKNHLW
jgi:hypothetical protein